MGVGNWSWQSRNGLSTTVVHVDDMLRSYDEYRKEAEQAFANHMQTHYADRVPEDGDVSLDWAKEEGLGSIIEAAIGDEFSRWDDEQGYAEDESRQRYDDLIESMAETFAAAKLPGVTMPHSTLNPEFDRAAQTIARSEWAQVVVRQWESYIFFGVGPSDMLANVGDLPTGTDEAKFIAKCWAACDPKSTAFFLAADKKPAPIQLTDEEKRQVEKTREYRSVYHPNGNVLTSVVTRLRAQASELDTYQDNIDFYNAYGISPHDLDVNFPEIEDMIAFVEEYGGTPEMVIAAYEREHSALTDVLMTSLALDGEKPYCPNSAWTSKPVDMSPYLQVAVVQLSGIKALGCIASGNPLGAIGCAEPGSVSFMRESEFDRTLAHDLASSCPHKVSEMNDGMFTFLAPSNASIYTQNSAVLVFRGRMEWGHFHAYEKKVQEWMQNGASAPLENLPSWMSLTTSGEEIRSVLDSLPPGAPVANCFDDAGDLLVTGALVESRDGAHTTVFVTTSNRPEQLSSQYEALVLNGVAVKPAAPSNDREATYG